MTENIVHSAKDLARIAIDLTGDTTITADECADQMHSMDISCYEELTQSLVGEIAEALTSARGLMRRHIARRLGTSHTTVLHTLMYSGAVPNAMLLQPTADITDAQYAIAAAYLTK